MQYRRALASFFSVAVVLACGLPAEDAQGKGGPCPAGMAYVDTVAQPYCVDRFEGSLVEITSTGEMPFSPYESVKGRRVRAVSLRGASDTSVKCRGDGHEHGIDHERVGEAMMQVAHGPQRVRAGVDGAQVFLEGDGAHHRRHHHVAARLQIAGFLHRRHQRTRRNARSLQCDAITQGVIGRREVAFDVVGQRINACRRGDCGR